MPMPQKLTPENQQKLADDYANGASLKELSAEFGVSFSTVRATVLRKGGTLRNVGRPRTTN